MTCIIDGSHSRVTEFDVAIIEYAVTTFGMTLNAEDRNCYLVAKRDGSRLVSDLSPGECEYLGDIAREAVEFMNDQTQHDRAMPGWFYVEESCLWYEQEEDEWQTMTAAEEQAWLNGYFTPQEVEETDHGVLYR